MDVRDPLRMPQRSRGVFRPRRGNGAWSVEMRRELSMGKGLKGRLKPSEVERELVLAHREAV
jgi:hypothetical protein